MQARGFGFGHGPPEARQRIHPPARISGIGTRELFDQLLIHQPRQGAIEGARVEHDGAGRALLDRVHDVVAVRIAIGERQENLECDGREGQQLFG